MKHIANERLIFKTDKYHFKKSSFFVRIKKFIRLIDRIGILRLVIAQKIHLIVVIYKESSPLIRAFPKSKIQRFFHVFGD